MKRDTDLGWELIGHDPALRLELAAIEQHASGEDMVNELLEFYEKIEGVIQLVLEICEPELVEVD